MQAMKNWWKLAQSGVLKYTADFKQVQVVFSSSNMVDLMLTRDAALREAQTTSNMAVTRLGHTIQWLIIGISNKPIDYLLKKYYKVIIHK